MMASLRKGWRKSISNHATDKEHQLLLKSVCVCFERALRPNYCVLTEQNSNPVIPKIESAIVCSNRPGEDYLGGEGGQRQMNNTPDAVL